MFNYTIYCTEEQTRKVLELGAPLIRFYSTGCSDFINTLIISDTEAYAIPTAEEMIGWLEEQEIFINVIHDEVYFYNIQVNDPQPLKLDKYTNRREATLAAIDSALAYLATK